MPDIARKFPGPSFHANHFPSNGNDLRKSSLLPFPYILLLRGDLAYFLAAAMPVLARGHSRLLGYFLVVQRQIV